MNYIDKIKKDGVVYNIKGIGGGSSSEAASGVSGTITYTPNSKGFQFLDNVYGAGQVNAVVYNETTYKLQRCKDDSNGYEYSIFLGNVEKTATNVAVLHSICLMASAVLFDYDVTLTCESDGSVTVDTTEFSDKVNTVESTMEMFFMKLAMLNVPDELFPILSQGATKEQMAEALQQEAGDAFDLSNPLDTDLLLSWNLMDFTNNGTSNFINEINNSYNVLGNMQFALVLAGIYNEEYIASMMGGGSQQEA